MKSKLSRRIIWRVILIMLFFNVFIVGAVITFEFSVTVIESGVRAQSIIDGIGGKLETMLKAVETGVKNNVAEIEDNLDSPERVFDALEHELKLNQGYLGCSVAFEPDYYASQGRWFEPYVKFGDSIPSSTSRLVERYQMGSAQHDYLKNEMYQRGISLERGEGYMSDPYFDEAGGKRLLCSYLTPLFDRQGRKVGVYCVDLNLDWLEQTLIDEENKAAMATFMGSNSDATVMFEDAFFIQVFDGKGKIVAGLDTLDDKTVQTILKQDSIRFEEMEMKDAVYYISSQRISGTDWTLVVAQHKYYVLLWGYVIAVVVLFLMTVGGIVIVIITSFSIRHAVKPLRYLSDSAKEVSQGHFDTPLPTFKHRDEISQLRDSFDTMQQSLKRYVEELKESTAAKASIESELNVAHSIQMSMLPKRFPPFPERKDIEIYGMQKPAKAVGGDLYDFFIRDEKLFFCIGDVSGKGVPASLVMAVTRTLFRCSAQGDALSAKDAATYPTKLDHIVGTMNRAINESNDNNMFVTLFVGVLDLQTGKLRYCNAGHDAPYVLFEKGKVEGNPLPSLLPCDPNLPIGVMTDWNFTEQEMDLAPGTTIFLYTDGLTEAENAGHELFGDERVSDVITSFEGSTQSLIETMTDAVHQFVGDTEQSDDLTMLAIKWEL